MSEQFKDRYLDPIIPQMQLALGAIHELMEVMDEAFVETRDEHQHL